ncbi:MAG: trehalose-phosphatase [Proteobacteria bacterium]|nr:trehalose-phosphatase [Pseudomonadota bacterium]
MSIRRMPPYAGNWAFYLDIDGTLLEFAARPQDVTVDPELLELLAGLRGVAGGAVAVVSGRSMADVDRLFAPLVLPAACLHGAERRSAAGALRQQPPLRERLGQAASRVASLAGKNPGFGFEDKGLALALHYRRAPHLRSLAEREMRAISTALGTEFEYMTGKFVVEIKPRGKDKGDAITEFSAEPPFAGRVPVFIGDDLSDEAGFDAVNRLGGHSVKVGPGITRARWRLFDAAEVRRWLAACVEAGSGSEARKGAGLHG